MNRFAIACKKVWMMIPFKVVLSACILVYAIIMALHKQRLSGWFCVVAVTFCFLGDIALNHRKNHAKQTENSFKAGMLMFFLAHLFYFITYFTLLSVNFNDVLGFGGNWILFALVDIGMFFTVSEFMTQMMDFGEYDTPVLVYTLMIMTMLCMTIFYSILSSSINSLAAFGAASLVISDAIITFEKFAHMETRRTRILVWVTYVAGQLVMITFA